MVAPYKHGFTLVELAIVLVIIGLIVGGVLVGRDLIKAAEVRATIGQIEKYQTAVNAFRLKFNYLPGDMPQSAVTAAGFTVAATRAGDAGRGDGNGKIEGYWWGGGTISQDISEGENAWFWEDLSANSQLIDGNFTYAGTSDYSPAPTPDKIMPAAKLGGGNYIYMYGTRNNSYNYFGLSYLTVGTEGALYNAAGNPGLSVIQAANIDSKIDDGFPQSGRVIAKYENWTLAATLGWYAMCPAGGGVGGACSAAPNFGPTTAATPASSTTCYDNGNTNGVAQAYSVGQNGGNGTNCALSFRLQ